MWFGEHEGSRNSNVLLVFFPFKTKTFFIIFLIFRVRVFMHYLLSFYLRNNSRNCLGSLTIGSV